MEPWNFEMRRMQQLQKHQLQNQLLAIKRQQQEYRQILDSERQLKELNREQERAREGSEQARIQHHLRRSQHMEDTRQSRRRSLMREVSNYNYSVLVGQQAKRDSSCTSRGSDGSKSARSGAVELPLAKPTSRGPQCLPFPEVGKTGSSPFYIGNRIYEDSVERRQFVARDLLRHRRNLEHALRRP